MFHNSTEEIITLLYFNILGRTSKDKGSRLNGSKHFFEPLHLECSQLLQIDFMSTLTELNKPAILNIIFILLPATLVAHNISDSHRHRILNC
jgi:hypothetical protein